jgi:hypothetical protein
MSLVLTALLALLAQAAEPLKLGDVDLRDARDGDVIRLPACTSPRNAPVRRVGLAVSRHPAQIDRVVVRFHDGTRQELSVRHRFKPGSASRWIDLRGGDRCIQSIRIVGDTDSLGWRPGKQARVHVVGDTARRRR